jgi:thiol-disulfide isomerase/thioredoxin
MSQNVSKIIAIGLYALAFVFIFAISIGAQENPELGLMKAMLDCSCECRLTLAYCEKEDVDCSVRPALLTKLKRVHEEGKRGMELIRAFVGPMHPVKEQLMEARLQNRHAILLFYEEGSQACDKAKAVLKKGSHVWGDRVKISQVDINKKENKKVRQEFRIFSAPTILVIAPNGVVVREFRESITIESVEGAFASPAMAQILRGLQDRRVIFLPVAAADWKNASSVKKTVSSVGEVLRTSVRIVDVDPTNEEEKPLLKTLKVDKDENQSLTYVVSQSGKMGSRFRGPVSRKDLFMAFQKVLTTRSGCGGSGGGAGGSTCK